MRVIILPYGVTNYVLGVTSARFWQYAIGSTTYSVKLFFHCYVGAQIYKIETAKSKSAQQAGTDGVLFAIEVLIVIVFTILISIHARRLLDRSIRRNAANIGFSELDLIEMRKLRPQSSKLAFRRRSL